MSAATPDPAGRRAPRRPRRSRRSPTTRSSRTATPARSSRPTARSTGCACRASTRRASSPACSTARPGFFRFAPFGINHPDRARLRAGHERARDDVEDAVGLGRRPRRADDGAARARGHDHAAHAAAGRRRRRPHAGAHGRVHRGPGRDRARLRAGVRLRARRRPSGRWSTATATRPTRAARARRSASRSDLALGIEGDRVRARHVLEPGERAYCALSLGRGARRRRRTSTTPRRGSPPRRASGAPGSAGRGIPDHRWRGPDPALGARDQGPDLHAHRRHGRRAHDLAARDARRRAQLGLPLHLDARRHLHAAGAALAQPRLGGRRVHAVRRRPRADRGRRRCRSCTGSTAGAT